MAWGARHDSTVQNTCARCLAAERGPASDATRPAESARPAAVAAEPCARRAAAPIAAAARQGGDAAQKGQGRGAAATTGRQEKAAVPRLRGALGKTRDP